MKSSIILATLTFVAFVGSGQLEDLDVEVQLTPRGPQTTQPTDQPFKVQCRVVPNKDNRFYSLKWRGPKGDIKSRSGGSVSTFRYNNVLYLSFRKPTLDENGSYVCISTYQNKRISASVYIQFEETEGTCPPNSYLFASRKMCFVCPPNSYTASAGAKSLQECVCSSGYEGDPYSGIPCTETEGTCPTNSYFSEYRKMCLVCPPNSYTVSAGAKSLQECVCSRGYEGDPYSRIPCTDINECNRYRLGCSHNCVNTPGSAHCACPHGYRLSADFKTCRDIDECSSEDLNRCNHICSNTNGGYQCSCYPGYVLVDRYRCEGCRRNSYRSSGEEFCMDCPPHSATDGPGKTSVADCKCLPGFSGDPSRYIPCTDVDECEDNGLNCSDECVNTPGSAHCSCPNGYQVDVDGKTCIDVNECLASNGGCDGECENFEGGHKCNCEAGYELSNFYSCVDIDECASNNGGCGHQCSNFRGGYYCSCRDGFRLGSDQRSCVANLCPRMPQPQFSVVKCYKKLVGRNARNEVALDVSDYYQNGTACFAKCDKGYKSSDISAFIQCRQNGEWDGELPKCIVQNCSPLLDPDHGRVKPGVCKKGAKVGTRCTFSCRQGYRLKGIAMLRCSTSKEWILRGAKPPICEQIKFAPYILCSEDITAVLEAGRNWTSIIVPGPQTAADVKDIEVTPKWINANSGTKFPFGSTDITFTARNALDGNLTGTCSVTVNVIDEDPPSVLFCPESFTVAANSSSGAIVEWTEPMFGDNVMVHSVIENMKPGEQLQPGVYFVKYSAIDSSGNDAVCEFTINVTSPECGYPNDPQNGKTSCEDWAFGRLCVVTCDDGYMMYPPEPYVFSCDDSGVWDPTNFVPDCMPTAPSFNMSCPDGFELTISSESDLEICVECPEHLPWSEEDRTCSNSTVN